DYVVSGSARWKPVRVYNDGRKTIIEMPSKMQQSEAPALLVVHKDASLFKDDETQMVNYRVQDARYIVDTIFDKAILVSGVGSSQQKVTITRGN
ncbi:TrbG/VirB9 family P-type conjugative transfer protein, partial [Xylella fastidiosa]|uniref:TrbG/VirB9 family P-type conjugative transfer protein n=2 Tax=Xylella fastidiosa TaxID=2371 RepID=UPI001566E544